MAPGVEFINKSDFLSTLGFAFYNYEGIGIVMPVMATCAEPQHFKRMLTYTFFTLMAIFVFFGCVTYFAWGENLNEPIVTQMLPSDDKIVIIMKFLYSMNLLCSYPIIINPANASVEGWLCKCLSSNQTALYWSQNFSRLFVCFSAVMCSIYLASVLDKFFGLVGAVLCAPLAVTFPALLHWKHLAKTRRQKFIDLSLVFISLCILVFCTAHSIMNLIQGEAESH